MYSPAGRASGDFDAATVNLDFKSHLAHLWCICLSFGGSKQRSRAPLHLREKMYAGWHNFSIRDGPRLEPRYHRIELAKIRQS